MPTSTVTPSIRAVDVAAVHDNGVCALDHVSVDIEPAQLTAIIGPSGAGKTTLLAALAGVAPASRGQVVFGTGGQLTEIRPQVAYVPQEDILHGELSLRRTLGYAAALRLGGTSATERWAMVDEAMDVLGLGAHAATRVSALSGGQRKRASIAAEILGAPRICFLDEPTSGLDPAASARLIGCLRGMAAAGGTVVLTTHSVADIECCDRVVVLASGGRLVAAGTPDGVLTAVGVCSFPELYDVLAAGPDELVRHQSDQHGTDESASPEDRSRRGPDRPTPTALLQWLVLTSRSAETIVRNRLTLAILLGSPAAVIAMFAVLFRPGAFGAATGASSAVMVTYWLAFAGFFFGLTFGLLQVCAEVPVLRREYHAGVRIGPYLGSKLLVLMPFLLAVNAAMLVVLRALDRLPAAPAGVYVELFVTMGLNALAALCLGLLASALVASTAQAALALPMLCFPAVLFAGAVVPVPVMAGAGRVIAAMMPVRWAFEAVAGHLDVGTLSGGSSPYAGLGASGCVVYWCQLAGFVVMLGAGAVMAVRHRAASSG